MTTALFFTRTAKLDLERIGDFIARDNPGRAVTFVDELEARCRRITECDGGCRPSSRCLSRKRGLFTTSVSRRHCEEAKPTKQSMPPLLRADGLLRCALEEVKTFFLFGGRAAAWEARNDGVGIPKGSRRRERLCLTVLCDRFDAIRSKVIPL